MKKEVCSSICKMQMGGGYLENTASLRLRENYNSKNNISIKVTNVASFFVSYHTEERG